MEQTTNWVIDPMHSEVSFKVKHLVISTVTGYFRSFDGGATTQGDDFDGAQIHFSADLDSIDTNMAQRDAHLKSAEFFDAENHPKLTFQSSSFTKKSGDAYELQGTLTIRGNSHPVALQAEMGGTAVDFYGNKKVGFELTGKISRKAFGLTWDGITEAGAVVVSDEVRLALNIQLAQQA